MIMTYFTYTYIYIYAGAEEVGQLPRVAWVGRHDTYVHICVYIYIERERERHQRWMD